MYITLLIKVKKTIYKKKKMSRFVFNQDLPGIPKIYLPIFCILSNHLWAISQCHVNFRRSVNCIFRKHSVSQYHVSNYLTKGNFLVKVELRDNILYKDMSFVKCISH